MNSKHPYPVGSKLQVASLPIRHHHIMRAVVLAVSLELPQPGGDDAGEGTHVGPFNGVSLGAGLCSRTG